MIVFVNKCTCSSIISEMIIIIRICIFIKLENELWILLPCKNTQPLIKLFIYNSLVYRNKMELSCSSRGTRKLSYKIHAAYLSLFYKEWYESQREKFRCASILNASYYISIIEFSFDASSSTSIIIKSCQTFFALFLVSMSCRNFSRP